MYRLIALALTLNLLCACESRPDPACKQAYEDHSNRTKKISKTLETIIKKNGGFQAAMKQKKSGRRLAVLGHLLNKQAKSLDNLELCDGLEDEIRKYKRKLKQMTN